MKMHIVNLLGEMKDCGCYGRVGMAPDVLASLSTELKSIEFRAVEQAWENYVGGEGRVELDQVCNNLMRKYRQDTDPRTFTRTTL